jgi:TAT (twin-arginine translocation) pathway signal sequence
MRDQDLSRRQFLRGSSAAAAGALLLPHGLPAPVTASHAVSARITGATVSPWPYGLTGWLAAAKLFDSYVALPLAVTIQKIYMQEGQYYTSLPPHIKQLAKVGCQFIICVFPSRTTDDSAKLANFLKFLNSSGIVYQVALVNEWNTHNHFADGQAYRTYWRHYAPVVKAAGVPLCNLVCASSSATAYNKIQPGFPTSPLPDRYWIDYYATAYKFKVRLDTAGGLLDQAEGYGVPVGIAEFGWAAGGGTLTMADWDRYCPYLAGLVPRLPLGCLYWGAVHNGLTYDVVTGPDDPKVPGIQQVINAFKAG